MVGRRMLAIKNVLWNATITHLAHAAMRLCVRMVKVLGMLAWDKMTAFAT